MQLYLSFQPDDSTVAGQISSGLADILDERTSPATQPELATLSPQHSPSGEVHHQLPHQFFMITFNLTMAVNYL